MTSSSRILTHLDTVGAGTPRHGTATIEELENDLEMDQETLWEALAVLLLQKRIVMRSILKKRILVVKIKEGGFHAKNV